MRIDTKAERLKKRRTKIVATVGPASSSEERIAELIAAGVDVFRLNMSHGDHEAHRVAFERIRRAADHAGLPVAVLADLCGPKIRVGNFDGGSIEIPTGALVTVTTRDVLGHAGLIPSRYHELARDVKPGDRILLDDGNLELKVAQVDGEDIACDVIHGGHLSDRKGMNLPGVAVSAPSLTEQDRVDARFALGLGVDFLALSFVRRAADVADLRQLMAECGGSASIVAKIEKPEALENIDSILDVADAIMVARGDLGVELPLEEVPVAQDQLVAAARHHDRPVIVATQMLESMIEHARPTRAEVSDVSHAVAIGADAVMLSAETAAGAHPVEAVRAMDVIARQTEAFLWHQGAFGSITAQDLPQAMVRIEDAVARATAQISRDLGIRAIVVLSESGTSAAVVAAARPAAPVVAVTSEPRTLRRMSLLWGTVPVLVAAADRSEPATIAAHLAAELGLAAAGQRLLMVRGFAADPTKSVPSVSVLTLAAGESGGT